MRVLITGAGGFLGSHLISFLKQNPETNFKIFNLGKNKTKNSELLFLDDVKNKIDINRYISEIRPHYLFHLAGTSNTLDNLNQARLVNTDFSKFLLEAIEKSNLEHETKILIT